MSIYDTLAKLNISLPPVAIPAAAYVPFVQTGNLVFLSGHIAKKDGKPWVGQLGKNMDTAEGKAAARAIAIDLMGTLHAAVGDLNRVKRIVKLMSLVNSTGEFTEQHLVTNGASELFGEVFGPEDYADVPINTEDTANVLLRFDNGNKGLVTVSQVSAGRKNQLKLEISGSNKTFAFNSEAPNEIWIGNRDGYNQSLMRDPSLAYPEASTLMSFPGGHNEGFPDTSKQLFKEVYAAVAEGKNLETLEASDIPCGKFSASVLIRAARCNKNAYAEGHLTTIGTATG